MTYQLVWMCEVQWLSEKSDKFFTRRTRGLNIMMRRRKLQDSKTLKEMGIKHGGTMILHGSWVGGDNKCIYWSILCFSTIAYMFFIFICKSPSIYLPYVKSLSNFFLKLSFISSRTHISNLLDKTKQACSNKPCVGVPL